MGQPVATTHQLLAIHLVSSTILGRRVLTIFVLQVRRLEFSGRAFLARFSFIQVVGDKHRPNITTQFTTVEVLIIANVETFSVCSTLNHYANM